MNEVKQIHKLLHTHTSIHIYTNTHTHSHTHTQKHIQDVVPTFFFLKFLLRKQYIYKVFYHKQGLSSFIGFFTFVFS